MASQCLLSGDNSNRDHDLGHQPKARGADAIDHQDWPTPSITNPQTVAMGF